MLQTFFATAMRARARHLTFRRAVAIHVALLTCLGWAAAHAENTATLSAVGQLTLILGIIEGAVLVGWRLTQLPKSQALEFLLVSPVQPRRLFFAEALVGLTLLAFVTLSGLPVLALLVASGYLDPLDLGPLTLMPFTWGAITGLGLTVWAYESKGLRRIGEAVVMLLILLYLVVGVLAGENLRLWVESLPHGWKVAFLEGFARLHTHNPF